MGAFQAKKSKTLSYTIFAKHTYILFLLTVPKFLLMYIASNNSEENFISTLSFTCIFLSKHTRDYKCHFTSIVAFGCNVFRLHKNITWTGWVLSRQNSKHFFQQSNFIFLAVCLNVHFILLLHWSFPCYLFLHEKKQPIKVSHVLM